MKPVALQLHSQINCEDWKRLQDLRILIGGASLTCTHGKRQTKSQYNAVCEVSTALPTCHRCRQSKEIKRLTFKTKEKLFEEEEDCNNYMYRTESKIFVFMRLNMQPYSQILKLKKMNTLLYTEPCIKYIEN